MPDLNTVGCSDALDYLAGLPDSSADMILNDLPYGSTACAWDSVIPFAPLWKEYRRIIKPQGAIVLFGNQPFTSLLITSNLEWFKYCWVWSKSRATDFVRAKLKPMGQHEDIAVFSPASVANGAKVMMNYFPQGLRKVDRLEKNGYSTGGVGLRGPGFLGRDASNLGPNNKLHQPTYIQEFAGYPGTVLAFPSDMNSEHPTQKPVALCEYLIRTYTRPGDVVLDPTCGSGTTGVAARNTGRHYLLNDFSPDYVAIALRRLAEPFTLPLFAEQAGTPEADQMKLIDI